MDIDNNQENLSENNNPDFVNTELEHDLQEHSQQVYYEHSHVDQSQHGSEQYMPEQYAPEQFNSEPPVKPKLASFRSVCAKLGFAMSVYFAFRVLFGFFMRFFNTFAFFVNMNESLYSFFVNAFAILFIYIFPLLITMLIFNSFKVYKGKYRELYQKPKRLARALGAFPASFGLGHGTALLTALVFFLISQNIDAHSTVQELFRPTAVEQPTNLVSIIMLVFMLVVVAPILEEYWYRGIFFDALRPYGVGITIIITSILFGLAHGSLFMLFYATAYGFALGYIRYATRSLYTVTVLHTMVNAIAAGTIILTTLADINLGDGRLVNTFMYIYLVIFLALIVIGVIVFLSKIPSMRKYKIENAWPEKGGWKKTAWFFASIPVILMMILAANELSGFLLMGLLIG